VADGSGSLPSGLAEPATIRSPRKRRARLVREVRIHKAKRSESIYGNRASGVLQTTMIRPESPIACVMDALTVDERDRRAELFSKIAEQAQETQELADGYAIRFEPDTTTWMRVAEFITFERRCCPFLAFSLNAEDENGAMWLRITGRQGVKQFLAAALRFTK